MAEKNIEKILDILSSHNLVSGSVSSGFWYCKGSLQCHWKHNEYDPANQDKPYRAPSIVHHIHLAEEIDALYGQEEVIHFMRYSELKFTACGMDATMDDVKTSPDDRCISIGVTCVPCRRLSKLEAL